VSGRRLYWVVAALLAAALAGQLQRSRDLLEARRVLRQVEQISVVAATSGRPAAALAPLYWVHVELLRRAEGLDPADARLPLARGSQYLLLGRAEEAVAAYREALAIEPRPEIYLNLGRAQLGAGDREAARESFRRALALDPFLRQDVPPEMVPAHLRPRPARPAPPGGGSPR
jgi:tetratricopeptide (TPR) repeat protein